jgi:hypothetical protein
VLAPPAPVVTAVDPVVVDESPPAPVDAVVVVAEVVVADVAETVEPAEPVPDPFGESVESEQAPPIATMPKESAHAKVRREKCRFKSASDL